jgi:hypothetical protein
VDESPPSVGAFYNGLFGQWLEANRSEATVNIRIISDMIAALLANKSPTEGVGHKPIELCTVMTDGSVEAHDVLRIAGDGFTQPRFNLFDMRSTSQERAALEGRAGRLHQPCAEVPKLQVHERLRRRLPSAPLFQGQRLRQSVSLLRRPLFDVREHADRAGGPPLRQQAGRRRIDVRDALTGA